MNSLEEFRQLINEVHNTRFPPPGWVPTPPNLLMKFHGALMIVGWLSAATLGTVAARYFKQTFVGKKFLGSDVWYTIHTSSMILTWTCTNIGIILIVIHVDGWFRAKPHSILGAIAAAITFAHPILAYFRPAVDHPKRVYFKWSHSLLGGVAFAVAMAAVFTGMDLITMQMPRWSFMLLFGVYGLFLGVHAIFTLLEFCGRKAGVEHLGDAPFSKWRIMIFVGYALGCIGLSIALTNVIFIYL